MIVGHPGGYGRKPFVVIEGEILTIEGKSVGHDSPTAWGHSGSTPFDRAGRIVALHNAYDSQTGVRYAVSWQAMRGFFAEKP